MGQGVKVWRLGGLCSITIKGSVTNLWIWNCVAVAVEKSKFKKINVPRKLKDFYYNDVGFWDTLYSYINYKYNADADTLK